MKSEKKNYEDTIKMLKDRNIILEQENSVLEEKLRKIKI